MPVTREDLARIAREAPFEDLPALLGALEEARAAAWARLTMPANNHDAGRSTTPDRDENLDANEAARRLGMSRAWLYRNKRRLPFTIVIGRRVVFSARGLERWNRQHMTR